MAQLDGGSTVYSKDRNTTLLYDKAGQLVGKAPGEMSLDDAISNADLFPGLTAMSKFFNPITSSTSGQPVGKPSDILPDIDFSKSPRDIAVDIASQIPLMAIKGGSKTRTAARALTSIASGIAADRVANPDKSGLNSTADALFNTLVSMGVPHLMENTLPSLKPRTTVSTTVRQPTTRDFESEGSSTIRRSPGASPLGIPMPGGYEGSDWESSGTGTTTPGVSQTTIQGPHQGFLGNIAELLSSIKGGQPRMANKVSKSGYVYPKQSPVQYNVLQKALVGLGLNSLADLTVNAQEK